MFRMFHGERLPKLCLGEKSAKKHAQQDAENMLQGTHRVCLVIGRSETW
jgi:hypothetical protein